MKDRYDKLMLGKEESENHCEMEARFERPVAAVNNEGEMRFILNIFVVNVFIKVYIQLLSFSLKLILKFPFVNLFFEVYLKLLFSQHIDY